MGIQKTKDVNFFAVNEPDKPYCTMQVPIDDDEENDPVTHPSHYRVAGVEAIDIIRDSLTAEQFIGYCDGNAKKYILRWQKKNGLEDLKKAQVYLGWLIEELEREEK